jgi:spoIIIJ-associated protein
MAGAAEAVAAVRDLLEQVVAALGLGDQARVDVSIESDAIVGVVHGEELGLFIGRHGQTIDAVQHLAHRLVLKHGVEDWSVVVDAEGYRERRRVALEREADRAVEEAQRYGRPVALDAMTASERKLVHEYLRDHEAVETYSEGQEPDRHLVIAPVGGR